MLRFVVLAAAAFFSAVSFPADAKEALSVAPSSKWIVNYADDSCRLARSFGKDKRQIYLMLDRFQPESRVRATLVGKPVRAISSARKISFRFGSNGPEQSRSFVTGDMKDGNPALMVNGALLIAETGEMKAQVDDDILGEEGAPESVAVDPSINDQVQFVEVGAPGRPAFRLETGAMGAPLAALANCTDDLLRGWGVDAEAHKTLSRRAIPVGDPRKWLSSNDYPEVMRLRGEQGIVHFRLIVDETGTAKSCHIQQSTRPREFDDAVCKGIMKRARFDPALDASGKPLASYYVNRVRFEI